VQVVDLKATRTLTALPALVRYLRSTRPAALIAAPDIANIIAGAAKLLAGGTTRVIATNHINVISNARNSCKIQEKTYPLLLRLLAPVFYGLVAVSRGNADALQSKAHFPSRKLHVIHNPIVRPEMDQLSLAPLQHPWFQPGQPPVILAVGRLEVQKDYPTLLRSFSLVRQHRPAHLVILGQGTQCEAILRLAEELGVSSDIDLTGFDLNPFRYMARCAVFVLSSAWEGFGNVLGEALACGAQIVSTDCPSGPAEILENGEHGRLVPVGDSVALARAIEAALDHPLPGEGLKERAKAFTSETAVGAYLQVLGL
jgi:glycosyltransferase involved in cell wall biosynthesis